MFFKVLALLSIFQVILAADSTNGYDFAGSKVLIANNNDDEALKHIQEGLNLMQILNANLLLKVDSLEIRLDQQRQELKKDLEELKAVFITQIESIKSIGSGQTNLIDIRGELNQQLMKQSYELKEDWQEIMAALPTQKGSTKSIDSCKANLTDIRDELNQQLTLHSNEIKKDLDEIKAALTIQEDSIKSIDSCQANLTDIRGEIYQQLAIQRNETKKDLEKLKATTMRSLPTSCAEALEGSGRTGIYKIQIPHSELEPFNAYCLKNSTNDTSAWLVIQRRQDGSIDFYRNWTDYQQGFGNLESEFFIGLDKLHALTQSTTHELWVQLGNYEGSTRWAKYSNFTVGSESELYALNNLGNYTGDAGDSLSYHKGMKWSTFDRDNDNFCNRNCAEELRSAFWYDTCTKSNLNGIYARGVRVDIDHIMKRLYWMGWNWLDPLKYVHMAIRPVQ